MTEIYRAHVEIDGGTFEALGTDRGSARSALTEAVAAFADQQGWAHGWFAHVEPKIRISGLVIGRGYRNGMEIA